MCEVMIKNNQITKQYRLGQIGGATPQEGLQLFSAPHQKHVHGHSLIEKGAAW